MKAYVSVSLFFSKPCETNTGVTEATLELCVKSIWTPHHLKPADYSIWLLEEVFLAMGRKKIQITRIVDERNRQVSIAFFFFFFCPYCRFQLLCLSGSRTRTGSASHVCFLHKIPPVCEAAALRHYSAEYLPSLVHCNVPPHKGKLYVLCGKPQTGAVWEILGRKVRLKRYLMCWFVGSECC